MPCSANPAACFTCRPQSASGLSFECACLKATPFAPSAASGAKAMSASGEQLRATNVVLVETKQIDSTMDAQGGAMVPDQEFKGTGKALVATGGKVVEASWKKKNAASPLELVDADGEPILLAPGTTWIEMLNKGKSSYTVD